MQSFFWILPVVLFAKFMYAVSARKLLSLDCQSENHGVHGQDSVLECTVKSSGGNMKIILVSWRRSGEERPLLWVVDEDKPVVKQADPRFSFAKSQLSGSNVDVSFVMRNTQRTDAGNYECRVVTDSGEDKVTVSLNVIALYSKPNMSSLPEKDIKDEMDITLFCNATGGYPVGVICWYDQYGTNWTLSAQTTVVETADKRFDLRSKFTLKASSSYSEYRCEVLNGKGVKEAEAKLELPFQGKGHRNVQEKEEGNKNSTAIAAVVVVIGSLLSGLLILAVLRRRRARRETTAPYDDTEEGSVGLNKDTEPNE